MAETQTPTTKTETQKSKRDLFSERLKKKYPDREYADDDALFGQINDDYDDYDNRLGEYQDRESKLTDLFSKDPRSAQFITDMAKGKDPWLSVIERLGIDGVTDLINDPEKQAEYSEANTKYLERLAKEKFLEDEYQKNFADSMDLLEKIQQERQLGDETIDAAMDLVMRMANEAIVGKFTEETINMALNAINHDADIDNARTEGITAGRNAKIEEKLRKPKKGDGMPNLAGSNNSPTDKGKKAMTIFDYADAAK